MRVIRECSVAVIGGAGFLGSHLVNHLIEDRSCKVLVLDNLISGLRKHIHDKAVFTGYDIREDEQALVRILLKHNIRYVFNYAAEPYIPECFDRPLHFFEINATAVLKVLNACSTVGVEAILQVSSAEIYGDMDGKIKETDLIAAHSTYGVSKLAADGLVQVRWREAKVPAIAMRQFNCIGERETHDYVVPEIISQIHFIGEAMRSFDDSNYANSGLNGEAKGVVRSDYPFIRLGNDSVRDFLYAGDAVRMAVELLEKGSFGEVYNAGSESTIRIYDLARLIGKLMGFKKIGITCDPARKRPWEIWHLQSNNAKLYSVIEFRPTTPLRDALSRTNKYFHDNGGWDW